MSGEWRGSGVVEEVVWWRDWHCAVVFLLKCIFPLTSVFIHLRMYQSVEKMKALRVNFFRVVKTVVGL